MGTLDIGLLRQAADGITSVARHPALAERPAIGGTLLQIAGHVTELADILEGLDLPGS